MFNFFENKSLNQQKIALLGLGRENQAFLSWLIKHHYPGKITVCDQKAMTSLKLIIKASPDWKQAKQKIVWQLRKNYKQNLSNFDYLFRSPGWPLNCPEIKKALGRGTKLSSPMNAFLSQSPSSKIIGVSGSKGKGTTATLIAAILKATNKKVFLGGNIGIAPFSFLDKIKKDTWIILELSSFQLEDINLGPKIGVLINFFPDHLAPADPANPNYHSSLKSYWQAKLNLTKQPKNIHLIVNKNLRSKIKTAKLKTRIHYFEKSRQANNLFGSYNQENIGAALMTVRLLKIPKNKIKQTIKNFNNLEHRLELVRKKKGVYYFNNSFATNPQSSLLDLKSFSQPIVQIAGGADKGADFSHLAGEIKKRVKYLILLTGKASPRLKKAVLKTGYSQNKIKLVNTMFQAISTAKNQANSGDIVLLSTACASFGIFKNYKDRGNQFKKHVKQIK